MDSADGLRPPSLTTGPSPTSARSFWSMLHLTMPVSGRTNGCPTKPGAAHLQQSEVHYLNHGPVDLVLIAVDQALFARHVRTRSLQSAEQSRADGLLRPSPGAAALPDRGRAINGLLSALLSGAITPPEAKHRLRACALHVLLDGLEATDATGRSPSLRAKLRVVRAAEEVLCARLDDPPWLSKLCEVLRVPERTRHAASHEGFGMTPKAYLCALHLSVLALGLQLGLRLRRQRGTVRAGVALLCAVWTLLLVNILDIATGRLGFMRAVIGSSAR